MNQVIQKAQAGGMTGDRSHMVIPRQPALISLGGVVWSSLEPTTKNHADFLNLVAETLVAEAGERP